MFSSLHVQVLALMLMILSDVGGVGRESGESTPLDEVEERIYAAVLSTRKHRLSGENPTVGVFYTRDGGDIWHHTGWAQGRTFAVMAVPGGRGDTLVTASGNGVMRTVDGGRFWKITTDWRVTEVQDVTINPNRPHQVFAATPYGLFRSDDLGETWIERSDGLSSRFVASVRVDRLAPDRVFAGTESGLFVSADAGNSWRAAGVTDPVRSIRQSPARPSDWVIGLQDRGVAVSEDGGESWRYGDGLVGEFTIYESEFDPVDQDVLYAGGWETGVLRSNDLGRTWSRFTEGLEDLALNVHALAVSRRHPGHIYAGTMGGGLHLSRDYGERWEPVAPDVFELAQVWDLYVEGEQ